MKAESVRSPGGPNYKHKFLSKYGITTLAQLNAKIKEFELIVAKSLIMKQNVLRYKRS